MIISISTMHIRLTALYKYVILQEELEKIGINLRIYLNSYQYKNAILKMADDLSNKSEYFNYADKIYKLNFIPVEGKSRTIELQNSFLNHRILDSDYIIWSAENDKMLFPPNKDLLGKMIFTKLRSCNDIFWHQNFITSPKAFWFPSKYYNNHYNIGKLTKIIGESIINKIDYVSPLEICDIPNPYINIKDLKEKYKIDDKKKTLIYYLSRPYLYQNEDYEKDIVDKFLLDKFRSKYNILFANKPYTYSSTGKFYRNVKIIDFVDYEQVMREIVSGVLGGISTATREALVFNKPVLSINKKIIHKRNFPKKMQEITNDSALKIRFLKAGLLNKHQFEGMEIPVNADWFKYLNAMFSMKFNYSKKKNIWCGNIQLIDKIKKELVI